MRWFLFDNLLQNASFSEDKFVKERRYAINIGRVGDCACFWGIAVSAPNIFQKGV